MGNNSVGPGDHMTEKTGFPDWATTVLGPET